MGRRLAVLWAVLLVVLLAPMPASAQEDGARPQGATLRVGLQQQIDSLNPFLGYSLAATDIFRVIYPTLTTYSPDDFSVMPELAESWESSPDKLTWTFHIRRGVQWSDGQPVTARDAAYTFNRMMTDPAAATANGNFVENFDTVTAPDDTTLVIRTRTPQATMLAIDAPIVPEHVWSKVADVASFANDQMPVVGSGPFTLTGYRAEQDITLTANPNFWRGAPKIAQLQFIQFKNSDAAVQALRKGEVDVVQKLTPAQFDALAGQDDITQVRGQGRRFYELILNPGATNSENAPIGTGHPALRDVRVRQAIDHAIDRQVLVDRVLGGYGQVGGGYLPPIFADFHWTPPQPRTFDPAAANRMLDEAGYHRGPDGIRRTPQGEPLNFDFVLHGDEPADAQVGEFVKRWLADLGITVELQPVSDNQLNDRTTAGDFDMVISGWSANPDPDYVLRLQTCAARPNPAGGGTNDTFLCDQQYDDLYHRQLAEFDPARRADLVKQAQARFYEQAAGLILYYQNSLEAYRSDRFSGFTLQPRHDGVIVAQQGYWGYYGAEPTEVALKGAASTDYTAVAWVLGGAVVLVGVVVALVVVRRRATADTRE
ncbi:peptide ABC transporter substrate-binding protein [Saccharopolyspora subtropica]|uniref:ABC transporter substrate-binding protein n=1 Tax=Saccharopolyspora thermophila TaxID=89367 RepID=A0A917K153_9PSEU|nr:ABC transporter substrate-binding protein [Saccharopolyspora subtropica]GGI95691.1 peptide ABC transporter substrate-binding protein [Saccharopolyspora subtropica]